MKRTQIECNGKLATCSFYLWAQLNQSHQNCDLQANKNHKQHTQKSALHLKVIWNLSIITNSIVVIPSRRSPRGKGEWELIGDLNRTCLRSNSIKKGWWRGIEGEESNGSKWNPFTSFAKQPSPAINDRLIECTTVWHRNASARPGGKMFPTPANQMWLANQNLMALAHRVHLCTPTCSAPVRYRCAYWKTE